MTITYHNNDEKYKPENLKIMAVIGHTTQNTSKLWVRLNSHGKWTLQLNVIDINSKYTSSEGYIFSTTFEIKKNSLHTQQFLFETLLPETEYFYNITQADNRNNHFSGSFKTLNKNLDVIDFNIHSCHDPFSNDLISDGLWKDLHNTLEQNKSSFCINIGDQIYVDNNQKNGAMDLWKWLTKNKIDIIKNHTKDNKLDTESILNLFIKKYQITYNQYWEFYNLQRVFKKFPQYMIWDDHEIKNDWGSHSNNKKDTLLTTWYIKKSPYDKQLIQLMIKAAEYNYIEFQHKNNPPAILGNHPIWDYSLDLNNHNFFITDYRGQRNSTNNKKEHLILGEKQHIRLNKWLDLTKKNKNSILYVIIPVPIVFWSDFFSWSPAASFFDRWVHNKNTTERNTLLDLFLSHSHNSKCPIIILSGDVHGAGLFEIKNKKFPNAKLLNAISSGISRKPANPIISLFTKRSGRLKNYYGGSVKRLYLKLGVNNFLSIKSDSIKNEVNFTWKTKKNNKNSQDSFTIHYKK